MISIVILSYLRIDCTIRCLESLIQNSTLNHEIIVIQQSGKQEYTDKLKEMFPTVKIIHQQDNLGVAKGRNFGASFVTLEYVLFLDNDCTVDKEWDKSLLPFIDKYKPDVFISKLKGNGKVRVCEFLDWTFGPEVCSMNTEEESLCTYIKGVAFHNLEVFNKLGGFDENYFIRYEDADYSLRARDCKLMYTPHVSINHIRERSNDEYNVIRWSNKVKGESRRYFRERWKEQLKLGIGNVLLTESSPRSVVEQRINQIQRKRVRYEFFRDTDWLISRAKEIHGIDSSN